MTRNVQLIRVHHEKYLKLVRYPEATRKAAYEAKVPSFREQAREQAFDIPTSKGLIRKELGKLEKMIEDSHRCEAQP